MDKELFEYLSDMKIENIKLKKQLETFTDTGINKFFEQKCDILLDVLYELERAGMGLQEPRIAALIRDTSKKLDDLTKKYQELGEL